MIGNTMLWWQHGIIYQIYPRSFKDSNGDGIGDLRGIISQLDYLDWLSVDAVWISPFYPSPMIDFGYDVSSYTDVDPIFGDMAAFDDLVQQAHRRNLKVIIDFVINHTSDQHPWFLRLLIVLNFSHHEQTLELPAMGKGRIALSTYLDREDFTDLATFRLRSDEGCIIELADFH